MIPRSFINGLIERVDIVDVVGAHVQLRKAGANHSGRCPFHDEKTPSFHVYPDGHYHCFGCGAHGTTLGFLMERDGLEFPEAVEALAAIAGVEVPREQGTGRRTDTGLYEALNAADAWFRDRLRNDPEAEAAAAYLKGRGLSGTVTREFGIGLAPSGWDGLKTALASFGEVRLAAAGLLAKNDRGGTYDRFRARITFPIRDTRGRVIGFGGRVFQDEEQHGDAPPKTRPRKEPKYLNSPETDVFRKGRELYGLFEARRAQRPDCLIVVEGYMDVVALAQHGVANAVATLGTAVGQAHFEKLFRFAERVVCCFDGDEAGRNAAWKAVDAAFPVLSAGRRLGFVFLPDGEDPDTVVRSRGSTHFESLLDNAVPVGEYFLGHLRAGLDLERVDVQATLCDLALPHIGRLPEGTLRSMLVRDLARLGHTEPTILERRLHEPGRLAEASPPVSRGAGAPAPRQSKLATRLLHLVIKCPQLVDHMIAADRARLIEATADGSPFGEAVRYLAAEPGADTAMLLGRFVGDDAYPELAALAEQDILLSNQELLASEFADGVDRYLAQRARASRSALYQNVRERGSREELKRYWDARSSQDPQDLIVDAPPPP